MIAAAKWMTAFWAAICISGCEALVGAAVVGAVPVSVVAVGAAGAAIDATNPATRVDAETRAAVTARVPVYSKHDPQLAGSERIGDGSAMSCERMPDDPPASEEEALVKLRLVAEQAGGNAVILSNCDARGKVSFTKNCYTWVMCKGTIVRTPAPHGEAADVEIPR
jgi:hypothetical protein